MTDQPERTNKMDGFDQEKVQDYKDQIVACLDQLESLRGSYMADCRAQREKIKAVYDEAKDTAGIPKVAFKHIIKELELVRKLEKMRDDLEADMQETVEGLREVLGDDFAAFGLGAAAVERVAKKTGASLDSLTS